VQQANANLTANLSVLVAEVFKRSEIRVEVAFENRFELGVKQSHAKIPFK
jgi:hypothetical protein